ncbi:helix-turn-helix domain-containing protein [Paenibacillus qinlingensis]|uniref:helix-turn-helix domain-containing protein n=1 Tax=Paenibacillus qinlingensis TaxID=1837343 RepID=UPI001563EFDF|nr:helix-turn-helix domain-containing protein [Paenibacillus qinlingensis]NQX61219.1 AraC family transcriptional regulator [Paenibacillus qinlingensis]
MLPVQGQEYSLLMLSSIRKRRFHKRNTLHKKNIPGDMLFVVTQGKGILCIDNQAIPIKPNQTFYLVGNKPIEVMLESDFIEFYVLVIRRVTFSKKKGTWHCANAVSDPSLFQTGKLQLKQGKPHLEGIAQLYEECRSKSVKDPSIQLKFQSLIQEIPGEVPEPIELEDASKGIDQSITYMYKHFTSKIKLETLSDIAGLTPTSYSRSFKKTKKMSPVEYLNHIRIDASKELLLLHEPSIKDISTAVGFGNEFYFSRMFKNSFGISPTMYVKRKQLKVAVASCFRFQDCLRDLGVEDSYELNGYRHLELGIEENKRQIEVQLAEMRSYRPELIIADYRHLPMYNQLKLIAPTVMVDFSMDWRAYYVRIAELVGREKEAQQTFSQLDLRVKFTREALMDTIGLQSVSVIRLYSEKIRVHGMIDHPLSHLLYTELGLKPGSCVPLNERTKEYAVEIMPSFDTDFLLIDKRLTSQEEANLYNSMFKGTSWDAMKAVQNNQVRVISNWISMSWAPSGQNQILDDLLQWHA